MINYLRRRLSVRPVLWAPVKTSNKQTKNHQLIKGLHTIYNIF